MGTAGEGPPLTVNRSFTPNRKRNTTLTVVEGNSYMIQGTTERGSIRKKVEA